ncbi:putative membrane protein YeaQ/YmgE (transglycosylase-associated protein family) [Cryobacterium mesophilum]|uniref:DUF3180 domain-containing protein n=1 Tax=Terrimesophilobacter mesophilus TaxID=433647 RepID=A0A4R8VA37_9MICO|nr:DUF3180 domain-containing protein [Terrimesophilobacter mesophilus]MBB5633318.1 putative membrane protein YeaQ/YmgE (transglycosylase-associated protein family) [Terrimesophilobacter mesophilus]TFB80054.1 DUF3180 domain-containing protein [Terrimesophilobacter mesophilus]
MKRTRITTLVILGVVGAAGGAILELLLATNGPPIVSLPITLGIALAVIGGIVVTLAVPIRRMTRATSAPRVDPFYATRIVMLAKACALTGALIAGVGAGVLAYLLTRTVIEVGSVAQAITTIVGAGVLLAGGLLAEHMCRIPPGDDDNDPGKEPVKA